MKSSLGNELRIGNLIKIPIDDIKFKIGKVYKLSIEGINNSIPSWKCQRIKLTKDWFNICGFKQSGPNTFYKEFGDVDKQCFIVHMIDGEVILSHYGTVIDGVHHLQNLWMDITKEFLQYDHKQIPNLDDC